jgi:two-component system sensor histidine kinase PrrB
VRLSTRFTVALAVSVPLLVLLAGALVVGLVGMELRAERDRLLTARLSALAPIAGTYAWTQRARPGTRPRPAAGRGSRAALGADGPGGVVVEVPDADPLVIGDAPARLPGGGATGPADHAEGERGWRYAAADLGPAGNLARLWVFEPGERVERQLTRLRRGVGFITLIAAVAGAGAGLVLGRLAVRPLTVLRRQAQKIDRAEPGAARLGTSSRVTEIDELAALLNDLLDRRDAAVARTGAALETARAFAATVAHELRTPLTSMGANIDLLRHPGLPADDRAEVVAELDGEHARAQRLITLLRALARGELVDAATFTDIDLAALVEDATRDARRRHPHAAITFPPAGEARVRGWAEGLRVIVDNLLDNAAAHGTDPSGRADVTVTLTAEPDGGNGDRPTVVLAVRDRGSGVPAAERERVFDRFHRRASSPGSGLGLTLVRQQAVLHGGEATVTDPEDGVGARFEVRLPRAGGPPERPAPERGRREGRRTRPGEWLTGSRP